MKKYGILILILVSLLFLNCAFASENNAEISGTTITDGDNVNLPENNQQINEITNEPALSSSGDELYKNNHEPDVMTGSQWENVDTFTKLNQRISECQGNTLELNISYSYSY